MGIIAKRSSMIFFSDPADHYCHRVRIVLAEKDVAVEIKGIDPECKPAQLADVNPYNSLPTLVDRDLVLYEANIMMEYLDERFPHPPLLPAYPVTRSKSRLMIHRIEKDLCHLVDIILSPLSKDAAVNKAKKELREQLITIAPIFAEKIFFMSDDFSLIDCCLLPILWRLRFMGIELPHQAQPLTNYAEQHFQRDSFLASLSNSEEEMHL